MSNAFCQSSVLPRIYVSCGRAVVGFAWVGNRLLRVVQIDCFAERCLALAEGPGGVLVIASGSALQVVNPLEATRALSVEAEAHRGVVTAVQCTPASNLVVTAGSDNAIRVWLLEEDALSFATEVEATCGAQIESLLLDSVSKTVLSADGLGILRTWHLEGGVLVPLAIAACTGSDPAVAVEATSTDDAQPTPAPIHAMQCSVSVGLVLTGGADGVIRVWRIEGEEAALVAVVRAHSQSIRALHLAVSAGLTLSAGDGRTIRAWHMSGDALLPVAHASKAHGRSIVALHYDEIYKTITSMDAGHSLRAWQLDGDRLLHMAAVECPGTLLLQLNAAARLVLGAGLDGGLYAWRLQGGALVTEASTEGTHPGGVCALQFDAPTGCVLSGGADGSIRAWRLGDGQWTLLASEDSAHDGGACLLQFDAPSGHAVSWGKDACLRAWHLADGDVHASLLEVAAVSSPCVSAVALGAASRKVVSGGEDAAIRVWHLGEDELSVVVEAVHAHDDGIWVVEFCEASGLVVSTDGVATRAWHLQGRTLKLITSHTQAQGAGGMTWALRFDASSGTLLSTRDSGAIHVWRLRSSSWREVVSAERAHSCCILALQFDASSGLVLTADEGGTVRAWQLQDGDTLLPLAIAEAGAYDDRTWATLLDPAAGVAWRAEGDDLKAWRLESGEVHPLSTTPAHERGLWALQFQAASGLALSAGEDTVIRAWELRGDALEPFRPPGLALRLVASVEDAAVRRIWALQFHAPSGTVISAGTDKAIRAWHWSGVGALVQTAVMENAHADCISVLQFDGASGLVLSGGLDRAIRVWHVSGASFRALSTVEGAHSDCVMALHFDGATGLLLSSGEDKVLRAWRWAESRLLMVAAASSKSVLALQYDASAGTVLSAGVEGAVQVWRLRRDVLRLLSTMEVTVKACVWALQFDPLSGLVVCTDGPGIWVGLLQGDRLLPTQAPQPAHEPEVRALHMDALSGLLVSSGDDGSVQVWRFQGHSLVPVAMAAEVGRASALHLNAASGLLLSAGEGQALRLWHLGPLPQAEASHGHGVLDLQLDSTSGLALSAGEGGSLRAWHLRDRALSPLAAVDDAHGGGAVWALQLDAASRTVLSGGEDGALRVWHLGQAEFAPVTAAEGAHEGGLWAVRFDPASRAVVTAGADGAICAWYLVDAVLTPMAWVGNAHDGPATSLCFSAASGLVLSAGFDGTIRSWRFEGDALLPEACARTREKVLALQLDAPSGLVVGSCGDLAIRVWCLERGFLLRAVTIPEAHLGCVWALCLNRASGHFLSAGEDGVIRVWALSGYGLEKQDPGGARRRAPRRAKRGSVRA